MPAGIHEAPHADALAALLDALGTRLAIPALVITAHDTMSVRLAIARSGLPTVLEYEELRKRLAGLPVQLVTLRGLGYLLLEANGWAVNAHMKVTARIARVFVFTPPLPKESVLDRRDLLPPAPGEGRGKRWFVFLLLVLAAGAAVYVHLKVRPFW